MANIGTFAGLKWPYLGCLGGLGWLGGQLVAVGWLGWLGWLVWLGRVKNDCRGAANTDGSASDPVASAGLELRFATAWRVAASDRGH